MLDDWLPRDDEDREWFVVLSSNDENEVSEE